MHNIPSLTAACYHICDSGTSTAVGKDWVCEDCIRRLRPKDALVIRNVRCTLVESRSGVGEREEGDELFQGCLPSDHQ